MQLEEGRQKLEILARADHSVELARVGIAAIITEQCQAYLDLTADPPMLAALRTEIEALAQSGAAPRRVYAALLLGAIDPAAGKAALEAMSPSEEQFNLALGGCTVVTLTLRDAVAHLLGRPPWQQHTSM